MKKAIFAGSFDPMHEGHLKVIAKACKLFDQLFVVIATNVNKNSSDIEKRKSDAIQMITESNVEVHVLHDGYLADFAKSNNIKYLIRSARDVADYSYELEMASANNSLNDELETVIIIPDYKDIKFRSSLLKLK